MEAVAKTAYYCCGVRAADAASPKPICGDTFAARFMEGEGTEVFRAFEGFKIPNASNAVRARIIDDWLKEAVARRPDQLIVLLGAGFDTRAFRLGSGRFLEIDQHAVIARKEALLPAAQAPVPLTRVTVDFERDDLAARLSPWAADEHAIVVLEGVSEYLTQPQLSATANALRRAWPAHDLICDLMTETFRQRYAGPIRAEIRKLGADFAELSREPPRLLIDAGYRQTGRVSIPLRARELGVLPVPVFLLNTVLRSLRDGYCVYRFSTAA